MSDLPAGSAHDGTRTDGDLARLDLLHLLRRGLVDQPAGADFRALFGGGAVGAAVRLDGLEVQPASVAFLSEVVRAGGAAYAAELAEPLPEPAASAVVSEWLQAAAEVSSSDGLLLARWLASVATLIDLRQRSP